MMLTSTPTRGAAARWPDKEALPDPLRGRGRGTLKLTGLAQNLQVGPEF